MTIEGNIRAKKMAKMVFDFAEAESGEELAVTARYWEELHRMIGKNLPKKEEKPARRRNMTNEEARAWAKKTRAPFGEFAGYRVCHIPLNRLQYYDCGEWSTFLHELHRYLGAPCIQDEMRREHECDD